MPQSFSLVANNRFLDHFLLFLDEIRSHITLGFLITTENGNHALILFLYSIIPVHIAIISNDIIIPAQGDLHLSGRIRFGITVVDSSISKIAIEVSNSVMASYDTMAGEGSIALLATSYPVA